MPPPGAALAAPSPVCPFCKGAVAADVHRFGGNCPHCMLEIPGEEAPTDPGLQARQRLEQEQKVRQAQVARRNRVLAAVAALGVCLAGAGGYALYQSNKAATTFEMDDYYVMPLEEIREATPGAPPTADAAGAVPTSGRPAQGGKRPAGGTGGLGELPAVPDAPVGSAGAVGAAASDALAVKKGGSSGPLADAQLAGVGSALPSDGLGIGAGIPRIEQVGGDAVLEDDAAIFEMMKRVINALSPQVQNCYSQRLKQTADLKGAWKLSFTVAKDGTTKGITATGVNGADGELEACIVRTVGSWRFQKIYAEKGINKTYRFGPSEW